jgi:hypothetical protein
MSKNNRSNKKGLSKQVIILVVAVTVVLSGAAVAVAMILRPPADVIEVVQGTNQVPTARTGTPVITADNIVEIERSVQQSIERGMFETYMNTVWSFPDGASASTNAVMGNSANNNFPFWFDVTLSGTGQVVYTSGVLPLGTQLAEIRLDTPLARGEYSAVVRIHMIDDNNEPVESNMGFAITLVVVN